MATYVNGKCVVWSEEDWTPEQIAIVKANIAADNSDWLRDMNSKGHDLLVVDPYGPDSSGTYGTRPLI